MTSEASGDDGPPYVLPEVELLRDAEPSNDDRAELARRAGCLDEALAARGLPAMVAEVRPGPILTVYGVRLGAGVEGRRLAALTDDIALDMAAASARVVPMPGSDLIGIEMPSLRKRSVTLRELVAGPAFGTSGADLPIVLGCGPMGDPVVTDLSEVRHLLLAGATGSGKSVGLDTVLLSLLYRVTPERCRMIMIDPQRLVLSSYEGIPHLLAPVIMDVARAMDALRWALQEVDRRYRLMSAAGVRNLVGYNRKILDAGDLGARDAAVRAGGDGDPSALPSVIVVIDELTALVAAQDDDGEELAALLHRLAERGLVAGVHMLLSSNAWPSGHLDDLVGRAAAGRVSYGMADAADEVAFFGTAPTVEKRAKGDLLFMPAGREISLVHGPRVDEAEVLAVVDHWRAQVRYRNPSGPMPFGKLAVGDDDVDTTLSPEEDRYRQAVQLVVESGKASTSWLQRQLRIGYASAARLVERMEGDGIVGRPDHVGRRDVLIDPEGSPISLEERAERRRGWLSRLFGG